MTEPECSEMLSMPYPAIAHDSFTPINTIKVIFFNCYNIFSME